jgi:SPP1 family holin
MKKAVIIRTIVLVFALINQSLVLAGHSPLPFEDAEIENAFTIIFTVVASILAWWKNNSFTSNAQAADEVLEMLKKEDKK